MAEKMTAAKKPVAKKSPPQKTPAKLAKKSTRLIPRDPVLERRRMERVIAILKREYPDAHCSLDFKNPFELLIATILSAQCTDERVNLTTPALFKKFPEPAAMARAKPAELEKLIQKAGFFRMKAKSLLETSKLLVEKHAGRVPQTVPELTALRGVGRKTANVVLGNAFGIQSGVVVDTHVGRLSRRLGFTGENDPVKVEHELGALVPHSEWTDFSHWLIWHGRAICTARKAMCERCPLASLCPKIGVAVESA